MDFFNESRIFERGTHRGRPISVYDQWGRKKLTRFHALGLSTEVLWEKSLRKRD